MVSFHFSFFVQSKVSLLTEFSWIRFSNRDLKILHLQLYWDNWNACIIRFYQLCERSVSLKTIKTSELFKSLRTHCVTQWLLGSIQRQSSMMTFCLFHYRNLSQYFKKLYKSVSTKKINLKFGTVTSNNDLHQILKNQISVVESLSLNTNLNKR